MENPEHLPEMELKAVFIPAIEQPIEKHAEVLSMLCGYLDKYIVVYGIDDYDNIEPVVINRSGALALGMTHDGFFPDEADLYDIDELFRDSINPLAN